MTRYTINFLYRKRFHSMLAMVLHACIAPHAVGMAASSLPERQNRVGAIILVRKRLNATASDSPWTR